MTFLISAMLLAAPPLTAAEAVTAELGVTEMTGLSTELAAKYAADALSIEEVRRSPDKFPLRIAVLDAAEVLRASYKLKPISEIFEPKLEFAKKDIANFQEDLAAAILRLREASDELRRAAAQRKSEPLLRWQMHLDFLLATTRARAASLEELNLAYGKVHRNELPAVSTPNTGWKLSSQEKMASKSDIRRMMEAAAEEFEAIQESHPGTPWAKLAERELALKPGLAWEAAAIKPPPPPKADPRRRKK